MFIAKRVAFDHRDFLQLVNLLDEELSGRYGEEQLKLSVYNTINVDASVIVIYDDGQPIACGCFRRYEPEAIELKRMFVKPDFRGRGIASIILQALEKWGAEQGYELAFLETGVKQLEAIASYKKSGYEIIDNYGPYKNSSYSICMKKKIS
jgi:putative acetyltransferase